MRVMIAADEAGIGVPTPTEGYYEAAGLPKSSKEVVCCSAPKPIRFSYQETTITL